MQGGIIELDIHGMNSHQARISIDSALKRAERFAYRIRVIHGYNGGTTLRTLVRNTYLQHPSVLRIETRLGDGVTDLVLREF
ncbi:MAG: hypothetical protein E7337_07095 [Clostridiales bacterium]|nr:hypothetical protein [Clostridiales bacterium]